MFKFENEIKYLVIGKPSYEDLFLNLKRENPFLNIKYLYDHDVYSLLGLSGDQKTLNYLILKYKLSVKKAKRVLELINFETEIIPELDLIKKDLINKKLITLNALGKEHFKNSVILLIEEKENLSLRTFLSERIKFKDITVEDLDITKNNNKEILVFKDIFAQIEYVFSDIRRLIYDENIPANKIYIYVDPNKYGYYLSTFAKIFNLELNYSSNHLLTSSLVDFRNLVTKKDIQALSFHKILNEYETDKIEDPEFRESIEKELLLSFSLSEKRSNKGIKVISSPRFIRDSYLYILNFQNGDFYREYKDNDLYSDDLLLKMGVSPSYLKTSDYKRLLENFISYNNVFLSRVKMHLEEKIYSSQFVSELGLKEVEEVFNIKGLYTTHALNLLTSKLKDEYNLQNDEDYKTYNNDFKYFLMNEPMSVSASRFNTYASCPFKFYIDYYLKVDDFDDNFYTIYGKFVHSIFEDVDNDLEFEEVYQKNVKEYYTSNKDLMLLHRLKPFIEYSYGFIKEFSSKIKIAKRGSEEKFSSTLMLNNEAYKINGIIDSLLVSGKNEDILTIIDYKTGATTFDPRVNKYGFDLQLPLYAATYSKDHNLKIGGFFLFNIPYNYLKDKDNNISKFPSCKLSGVIDEENLDLVKELDEKLIKVDGHSIKRYGEYISLSNAKIPVKEIIQDGEKAMEKLALKIVEQDFSVFPSKIKDKDQSPCTYCKYRDICYFNATANILEETQEDKEEDGTV